MVLPAIALSGCALMFGPKDNPFRSETIEVSTAEGCKLQRVAYVIRDEDYDFQKKMNADARGRQANGKYGWSGKCEDGYISGPGELTQELDYGTSGKVKTKEFFVATPGKPRKYYAYLQRDDAGKVSVTDGYHWQFMGTLGKHDRYDNIISDADCADTRDCRVLRDTLLPMLDADQRAKVAADSDRGAQADKQRVQDEIKRDEIAEREYEAGMRKIEDENRAQKRRWLAEKAQIDGGGTSGTLAVLGAAMQGVAASGGKNAAQVQALSGAMQAGGTTPAPYVAPRNASPASAGAGAQTVSPKSAAAPGNNGAGARDPFKYSANVNECLVTEPNPGMAGTDQWRNACSFKINITYCRITADRNDCAKQLLGAESLPAGGTTYLLRGRQTHHYVVCKEPFYLPGTRVTWNGERFSGKCQAAG